MHNNCLIDWCTFCDQTPLPDRLRDLLCSNYQPNNNPAQVREQPEPRQHAARRRVPLQGPRPDAADRPLELQRLPAEHRRRHCGEPGPRGLGSADRVQGRGVVLDVQEAQPRRGCDERQLGHEKDQWRGQWHRRQDRKVQQGKGLHPGGGVLKQGRRGLHLENLKKKKKIAPIHTQKKGNKKMKSREEKNNEKPILPRCR
jgi:hypothetical protein